MRRLLFAAIAAALSSCAHEPLPPTTLAYDGSWSGQVTLFKGGASCPTTDARVFVIGIINGRAAHGFPFIPYASQTKDGLVMPDGTLMMTGRLYQKDARVQGQFKDGSYDAVAAIGFNSDCAYAWHLTKG
jgi:hypothetical protein